MMERMSPAPSPTPKRGKITVVKDAQPDSDQNFTISIAAMAAAVSCWMMLTPDDGDANHNSETVSFAPGNYTLTELNTAGWNLASLSCETTDTGDPVSVSTNLATIALDPAKKSPAPSPMCAPRAA